MAELYLKVCETDYNRMHKTYAEKTGQDAKLYELLCDILPSAFATIGMDLNKQKQINILSIGSGDGQTDFEILKIINHNMQERLKDLQGGDGPIQLFNRAIEPNESAREHYKVTAIEHLSKELSCENVTFKFGPRTFEDYAVQPKDDVKFDLVHFMHSLYYIDVEEALVHCYNTELREKGMIVVCVGGLNDLMWLLETQDKTLGQTNYDKINQTISWVLKKYSWKFEEHIEEHFYDISDVLDSSSKEGRLFLDFVRFEINLPLNNSLQAVQQLSETIKKHCVCKDGKYFAKSIQRIVLIYK